MRLIRGLHNLERGRAGCVATVGNFDGVHLGHQAIIEQVVAGARALRLPALVSVFEPQPREYFSGAAAPTRLSRLREKSELLAAAGVDELLCVRFDAALAALPADEFVERLLVRGLGVRRLIVGDDFRFGRNRGGTVELLRALGSRHGYTVERAVTRIVDGARVSSTRVRHALAQGDLQQVRRLLGRDYRMDGRVVGGTAGRGGFDSVTIDPRRACPPLTGTFAALVHGAMAPAIEAMVTIDAPPQAASPRTLMALRVLDPAQVIQGRRVAVEFVHAIRPGGSAQRVESGRTALAEDLAAARAALAVRRGHASSLGQNRPPAA
jgi:riboflavin kinase/FMN adenylyltransferase